MLRASRILLRGLLCLSLIPTTASLACDEPRVLFERSGAGQELAAVGDFDGDGLVDLLYTLSQGGYSEIEVRGLRGSLFSMSRLSQSVWPAGLGDVNGDGYSDILFKSGGVLRIHGGPSGALIRHIFNPVGTYVGVGDMDRDGFDDVGNLRSQEIIIRSGRTWRPILRLASDSARQLLSGGDMDGDGVPDLITTRPADASNGRVHETRLISGHNGQRIRTLRREVPRFRNSVHVQPMGDTNGDSLADVALIQDDQATVYSAVDGALLYGFPAVDIGGHADFNSDGIGDFYVRKTVAGSRVSFISGLSGTEMYSRVLQQQVISLGGDYDGDQRSDYAAGYLKVLAGQSGCALPGNVVNVFGEPVSILKVNGTTGDPQDRTTSIRTTQGLEITIDRPPGAFMEQTFGYAIYVWPLMSASDPLSFWETRGGFGGTCLPCPLTRSRFPKMPQPTAVLDATGHPRTLAPPGIFHATVPPGPGTVLSLRAQDLPRPKVLFIQGVVFDPFARNGGSVTNGIRVVIEG